jgi:hypothetical protein
MLRSHNKANRTDVNSVQPQGDPLKKRPSASYGQKIEELHKESLALQRRFLDIVVQIRESGLKDEAIDEVLLYRRDILYKKFNRILNLHRRLKNYVISNNLNLSEPIDEKVFGLL